MDRNYSVEYFQKRANRRGMTIWMVVCLVLSGAYYVEVLKNLRTMDYYISFLCVA